MLVAVQIMRNPRCALMTVAALVLTLLTPASNAAADSLTFRYTGLITSVEDDADFGLLPDTLVAGMPFAFTFTFESASLDAEPGDDRIGLYSGALQSVDVDLGYRTFSYAPGAYPLATPDDNFIRVADDPEQPGSNGDEYLMRARTIVRSGFSSGDVWLESILKLESSRSISNNVFDSDLLPLTAPDPAAFNSWTNFSFFLSAGGSFASVNGTPTSAESVSAVPIPPVVWLMAPAFCLLAPRVRRRKASS